jgi:TetR/AcrR family transcriptional regulator
VKQLRSTRSTKRDPARTRERSLAAALREFSLKGFSSARVDGIARHAAINKRMLYHYFGNKEALFREVLRRKIAQRVAWRDAAPLDPVEWLPYWFDVACRDLEWTRLLQWEALQMFERKIVDEKRRRRTVAQAVEQFHERQELGLLPKNLDPRHVLLSMVALTMFPISFPQLTKLVTGCSVFGERFVREYAEFLRRYAALLRPRSGLSRSLKAVVRVPPNKRKLA